MRYVIKVKQLVSDEKLSWDDRNTNPSGERTIEADSEDEALDEFHWTVPIKVLDHFEITCEPCEPADVFMLPVRLFFTPEDQPTCAVGQLKGDSCTFLLSKRFGTEFICYFRLEGRPLLRYGEDGRGYLRPCSKCPIHNLSLGDRDE